MTALDIAIICLVIIVVFPLGFYAGKKYEAERGLMQVYKDFSLLLRETSEAGLLVTDESSSQLLTEWEEAKKRGIV